ncbi:MAG: hypothetical protein ACLS85_02525 [Coprobacillus cateniformis]
MLKEKYDGIMLSNGPGDPEENVQIIEEIKSVLQVVKHRFLLYVWVIS